MKEKLRAHLEGIFREAPDNQKNRDLKEEFYANLCDRYDEYIAMGKTEDEAYMLSIRSLGDIHSLIGIDDKKPSADAAPVAPTVQVNDDKDAQKKCRKRKSKARRSLNWPLTLLFLIIYFVLSFITHAWYITWVVFLIHIAVNILLDGIFELKEDDKE